MTQLVLIENFHILSTNAINPFFIIPSNNKTEPCSKYNNNNENHKTNEEKPYENITFCHQALKNNDEPSLLCCQESVIV